jgi:hypothetical protein
MALESTSVLTADPCDSKLSIVPGDSVQAIDFGLAEGTEVELLYDPCEEQPFRIQVNGTTEEAYAERSEAEIAFQNLLVEIAEANREAEYQRRDRERF